MGQAAEVYAKELQFLKRGHPLWYPDPDNAGEIHVGDVGYMNDGSFHRMFNVSVPRDHPWNDNAWGVPAGFVPVTIPERARFHNSDCLSAGVITSDSVCVSEGRTQMLSVRPVAQVLEGQFECEDRNGAMLAINYTAEEEDVDQGSYLAEYVVQNHQAWYAFATEGGLLLEPNELLCVSACVKTSEWVVGAFINEDSGDGEPTSSATTRSEVRTSAFKRWPILRYSFPIPEPTISPIASGTPSDTRPNDQTIFIKFYQVKYRAGTLKAAELDGASVLTDDTDSDWSVEIEQYPPKIPLNTPLNDVLDYLLATTDADIAVTSHNHLYRVSKGDLPYDLAGQLQHSHPKVEVNGGVATLA